MLRVAPGFLLTPDSIYQFSPILHTCRCIQGLLDHTSPHGSKRWTGHLCRKSNRKYFVRVSFHNMLGGFVSLLRIATFPHILLECVGAIVPEWIWCGGIFILFLYFVPSWPRVYATHSIVCWNVGSVCGQVKPKRVLQMGLRVQDWVRVRFSNFKPVTPKSSLLMLDFR